MAIQSRRLAGSPWRRVAVFVVLLLGMGFSQLFAQLDFVDARRDLEVGVNPRDVKAADFDNDGILDLVVSNGSSNSLSILFGHGSRAYARHFDFPLTGLTRTPEQMVIEDFNGDGEEDIAVAIFKDDKVQVVFGTGNRSAPLTLGPFIATGADTNPKWLASMDWNLDNKKDLVVVLSAIDELRVYNGDGLGGFSLHQSFSVGTSPSAVVAGFWDDDTLVDLAACSQGDNTVTILYGGPTGFNTCAGCTFTFTVQDQPQTITSGLVDYDGFVDLVVGSAATNSVSILLADPFCNSGPPCDPFVVSSLDVGGHSFGVAIDDLDADFLSDLAVGVERSGGQGSARIFKGDGLGNFVQLGGTYPIGSIGVQMFAGDLDADSNLDLVTANVTSKSVSLLYSDGLGMFTATPFYAFPPGASSPAPSAVASGDLNGDTSLDLAVARSDLPAGAQFGGRVELLGGSGAGTFSPWQTLELPGNSNGPAVPVSVLVKPLSGADAAPTALDVASLNSYRDEVSIFINDGLGNFSVPDLCGLGGNEIDPVNMSSGMLNDADSLVDLVVANEFGLPNDGSVSILIQGSGPCNFAADKIDGGNNPRGVAVGMINADGSSDVVVGNSAVNLSSLLAGDGLGNFTLSGSVSTGAGPLFPIVDDLDGDGHLDLLTLNNGAGTVSVRMGDGAGNFTPHPTVPEPAAGIRPARGVLADLDGDGWDDLAIADTSIGAVSILLGDGTGRFSWAVRFGVGQTPRDVTTGDFNEDGVPDLATSDERDGTVSILINASQPPQLAVSETAFGTLVSWVPMVEAQAYDVIRGDLSNLVAGGGLVDLGAVTCIEDDSPDASTVGDEDLVDPPAGSVFFYFFRRVDPQVQGLYGRSSAGEIRLPASGDCL